MKSVNSNNFNDFIKNDTSIVQFSATWCGPCKTLSTTMDSLSKEFNQTQIGKIDIDDAMDIANQFNIRSVPVVILFENGKEKARTVGAKPVNAMRNFISSNLSTS
jgi:thioredoxin 1